MPFESSHNESQIEEAEIIPRFKGVKSWNEFCDAFDEFPITTGDGLPYTRENLNTGVEMARSSNFSDFTRLTRTEGLREVVACLLLVEARNLQELSNILNQITSITGSAETFTQAELLQRIQRVLNGENPDLLTSTYNLRTTVVRLVNDLK